MNPVVAITDAELQAATTLAEQTLRVFAKMPGHYNNTLNSHLRGKLGEVACVRWLEDSGITVDPLFRDVGKISACDIVASHATIMRLDVKTWDQTYWEAMGRCVAINQLAKLRAKADGVLWCVSSSKLEAGVQVEIAGWNTIADIEAAPRRLTGPAGRRQVDNHQVDPERLRPVAQLIDTLKRQ